MDPLSYFSFQPVLHDWCNKGRGMCYPVCGMTHIKEPLLLIGKNSLGGGSGFPLSLSEWSFTICLRSLSDNHTRTTIFLIVFFCCVFFRIIPYCSSDSWSGTRNASSRGQYIFNVLPEADLGGGGGGGVVRVIILLYIKFRPPKLPTVTLAFSLISCPPPPP